MIADRRAVPALTVVVSATGAVRELTRLPADAEPQFSAVTAVGGDLIRVDLRAA